MERYAKEFDLAHLASAVRAVSELITGAPHGAPDPQLQLSELVSDLDTVAEWVQDATEWVVEDVDQGKRGTWNTYAVDFMRWMKPKDCRDAGLNHEVPYTQPAGHLSDDDTDRAALLLAAAAAQALSDGIFSAKGAANASYAHQLVRDVKQALWPTEQEFQQVRSMTAVITAVLGERFELREKRVTARQATEPLPEVETDTGKADKSGAVSAETGASDMSTDTGKTAGSAPTDPKELMGFIIAANKGGDFALMLTLALRGMQAWPDAETAGPQGGKVKPFEKTAELAAGKVSQVDLMAAVDAAEAAGNHAWMQKLAEIGVTRFPDTMTKSVFGVVNAFSNRVSQAMRLQGVYEGSNPGEIIAAAVAAAPKAQAAPGVTVIDVTVGVRAAAKPDDETYGAGPAYGDLPAHGKLTVVHNASQGTVLLGTQPGDGHRQVFGSRGQRWGWNRGKKLSYLPRTEGQSADVERIRNAVLAARRGGWDVDKVIIDDSGTKPLKMTAARRTRHTETKYAAARQTRVEPKADDDADEVTQAPYTPPAVVFVQDSDFDVPGVSPAIAALCRQGEFDDDTEPFVDEDTPPMPAPEAPADDPATFFHGLDHATLMRRALEGDPGGMAEVVRRASLGLLLPPAPEPVDPFAGKTLDELLDLVAKGVPGALDAAKAKLTDHGAVEDVRPVTAPPAVTVPVRVAQTVVTDIRSEASELVVWILAANTSKDTRRGLNRALMQRVSWKSGEKDNRPTTKTTTHREASKFKVTVTVPAGVDRQHVMNLMTMVADDRSLHLHGITTPAVELVDA